MEVAPDLLMLTFRKKDAKGSVWGNDFITETPKLQQKQVMVDTMYGTS